jgi:multidrug resistance efflux pump
MTQTTVSDVKPANVITQNLPQTQSGSNGAVFEQVSGDTTATEPKPGRRGAAGKAAVVILAIIGASLAWHVTTDLMAPTSSTGAVTALTALVAPRVAGQVQQVFVADNQFVESGEPLFALDPAPFNLAVQQAEANLAQVSQTVGASVVSLTSAEAQVRQARSNLENVTAATSRTLDLFSRGLVPQSAVDTANAQLTSAQATLDSAEAELESARLRAGGDGTSPQVQTAEVQLEQAKLNRSFATVVAPADGYVTNLKLAPGQFMNAGTAALTFIEDDSTWVVVDMRENQLANIDVGDEAQLLFDTAPGRIFAAQVRGIAWGIDTGRTAANGLPQNQASSRWFEPARTIPVHLELAEGENWPANVRVGSKVSALVFAAGRDNPVAAGSSLMQTISSYFSFLY